MADLLALQPNVNILLFIVAEERRRKDGSPDWVPYLLALKKPLSSSCRYISVERLQERARAILDMGFGKALRPEEFLDTVAEVAEERPGRRPGCPRHSRK